MMQLYGHCWRGRTDCEAIECVHNTPSGITEEDFINLNFTPDSFFCCGIIKEENRNIPQDCYRTCFVSNDHGEEVDDMSDNDIQDLTAIIQTISAALSYDAILKVNSGRLDVPDDEGMIKQVDAVNH